MSKIVRLLLPALFLAFAGHAADVQSYSALFEEGNRLYAEGDFEGARKSYEEAVDEGARDPAVFLNLGHAEYKIGRPALALINYKRALALDPAQDAARQSLEHVEKELGQNLGGVGFDAGRYISYDLLALVGSLLVWGGLLVLLYAVFSKGKRGALASFGILAALLGATAVALAWKGDSRVALLQISIVTSETQAHASPSENSQRQGSLKIGDPVRVIAGNEEGWSFVELPNDLKGWVRSDALQPVLPQGL